MSKQAHDPMHIFVAAEQFRKAKEALSDLDAQLHLGMATISIAAISLELYLKCLLADEGKKVPEIHGLRFLFNRLSEETKHTIHANFGPHLPDAQQAIARIAHDYGRKVVPVAGFDYLLDISRNAFVNMRYFYETGIPNGQGWAADGILRATRKAIMDKHPAWEDQRLFSPAVYVTKQK